MARPPRLPAAIRSWVPWFSQLDSSTDQARRMCVSSSCAMLLDVLRPGILSGANGEHRTSGDTTDAAAQLQVLASYGIEAEFTQTASFLTLEEQIAVGITVPWATCTTARWSSPPEAATGFNVVGINATHVIVHDPLGEAGLMNGTTLGSTARFCRYSRRNCGRRGIVERNGSGWAVIAKS